MPEIKTEIEMNRAEEDRLLNELKLRADKICYLITHTDYPAIDIKILAYQLEEWVEEHFNGKTNLFQIIYFSRFKRLWEQFRPDEAPLEL